MRIAHYIAIQTVTLVAIVATLSFLLLRGAQETLAVREETKDDARALEMLTRFDEVLGHSLLIGDLILAGGSTYLVPIAKDRITELVRIIQKLEQSPLFLGQDVDSNKWVYLDSLQQIVSASASVHMASAERQLQLDAKLQRFDQVSTYLVDATSVLRVHMEKKVLERQQIVEKTLRYFYLYSVSATAILSIAVLISWWYFTIVIARPVQQLTNHVQQSINGQPFTAELQGPIEIFNLADNFAVLVDALEQGRSELEDQIKERTTELAEALDHAIQANATKSIFLANMSHELRTPLNAIIGYTEMILEDLQGEDAHDSACVDLQRVLRASNYLLELISDVLDLSKIEAGKMELDWQNIELQLLLEDALSTVQPMAEKNSNQLHLENDMELGQVLADPSKLRQILLNLLSNACKFTEGGSVHLSVQSTDTEYNKWLEISVRDTGIGISPDKLHHLFEPFEQIDSSIKTAYQGTGLGLAISQRLSQLHGGEIRVLSELGHGSIFTVRMPILVAPEL